MFAGKTRAIVFDIGNVLVRVDVERAMAGLAGGTPLHPQEIWTALQKDPRWRDWQEGRIAPREWHRHVMQRLGGDLSFEQFCSAWNRTLAPEPILDDSLLASLSRQCRLALLSNTDPIHVAYEEVSYSFFCHFPARIYSCAVGLSKPDPAIYKEVLRACGVAAPHALYVDDIPAYVEAARRLGMDGIVFSDPGQLQAQLRSRRLL